MNLKNGDGETPFDWVEEEKNMALTGFLRKHGGKTGEELK